jgi:hypothetical protein
VPKIIQENQGDDFQWMSDPGKLSELRVAEVDFLPIHKVVWVDKGCICFNDDFQVKAFLWKSKQSYKSISAGIATIGRPYFMVASSAKYTAIAEGDEGDIEGFYNPEGDNSYVFTHGSLKTTSRKKVG